MIEHGALKTRIGAHVLAYLLAHDTGIAIGGKTIEEDPEKFPATQRKSRKLLAQLNNWGEIAYECVAGPERECNPEKLLKRLTQNFFTIPGTMSILSGL